MENNYRVSFERPKLTQLTDENTVIDLHYHTRHSDGAATVEKTAQRARELGIGVSITDHNEIQGALEMSRIRDVFSIPGVELTSAEGTHILLYFPQIEELRDFFETCIRPNMGPDKMSSTRIEMERIIEDAGTYGSVKILAHPYSAAYTGIFNLNFTTDRINNILAAVDGVEVINGENLHRWNLRSALLGFNLNKAISGGSDGHCVKNLGRVVTFSKGKRSVSGFLNELKRGSSPGSGKRNCNAAQGGIQRQKTESQF